MAKIITLLTDFGLNDGYNGIMKGVIWKIAPGISIVDITHSISPQNVLEGAFMLQKVAPCFPAGTVHVGVVDPGVGTHRRPIAARIGPYYFIGPDNGLASALLQWAEEQGRESAFVHLDNPRYWLAKVSNVFHGRDIFAPVAAHLASGVPLEALGSPIADPVRLFIPQAERTQQGWRGQVISIDGFGNLSTNLTQSQMKELSRPRFHIATRRIDGIVETFGMRPSGELVVVYGTTNDLMIAVVQGSAKETLQVKVGDTVEVEEMP
jgi:S-adenosyl-L-methionine hydrolase (adenosine-forming)